MAEMVAGAFLSSFLNVLFDRMASSDFIDFFKSEKMDMGLLKRLQISLNTVGKVLDDAEDRQFSSKRIKNWLDELRDAAYEADDLLSEFHYEVIRSKVKAEQQSNDASLRVNYSEMQQKRMEEIVGTLEYLVQQSGALSLKETVKKYASSETVATTSVIKESGVFGRDEDKEAIVMLLLKTDEDESGVDVIPIEGMGEIGKTDEDESGVDVIPIVGMGGIGKTTLAQLVYNDSRVEKSFEIKAWVCVSENYDGSKIKREILQHINKSGAYDHLNPNLIDNELRKVLKDRRYLVVLDDMWNDDFDDWERLVTSLMKGKLGSKIIVTTRNRSVASRVCIVPSSYELRELDGEYCWQLFVKHAFPDGKVVESLVDTGKKIVRKCQGLPLALIMLGDLLRRKRDVREWKRILGNNIWDFQNDKVLPTLRLSYQHLSSQLKQCFSYLAIFPKGYRMTREQIIHLWMAEGFLPQKGGEMMEELGKEWVDELVSRSFLQKSTYQRYNQPTFLMHDLIHDLAQHNCGKFVVRMEGDNSCEISGKNRHFSYFATEIDISKIVKAISETRGLRTFLILPWVNEREAMPEVLHNEISQLGCLRVLSFYGFRTIATLPALLDKLKQLRYLNLAETSEEKLPESVCTLYNLQILILHACEELVELPKNMRNLINLYCLDIRKTPKLRETPHGMGNLKELRTLHKFFVGKQNGANIDDLGKLRLLQRELSIFNLQNVTQTSTDILKNKENLEDLELEWNGETGDSMRERTVLEQLQPCTSIEKLSICGYGGTKFADWVGDSSYMNIVSLKLKRCKYFTFLPPLGQLSSLEDLLIKEFDAVVEVGVEFCKMPFSSLKTLWIEDVKQWENWVICEEEDSVNCKSFPKLEKLTICNCPKLKSISTCEPTHKIFKSLNKLHVKDSPNLKTSNLLAVSSFKELDMKDKGRQVCLRQLPSEMYRLRLDIGRVYSVSEEWNPRIEGNEEMLFLFNALDFEEIEILGNKFLHSIPLEVLPKLRHLFLWHCRTLETLSTSEDLLHQPLLASLKIKFCGSLISFPKGGIKAPNLTSLILDKCSNLKSLPQYMHNLFQSLEHLEITNCGKLESFPEGGLPVNLRSLEIFVCNKLVSGRLQWGLQKLNALSHLRLGYYKGGDLDYFPEQTLLPPTLRYLEISSFENLKSINYDGLHHLTSLAELKISFCPNLQSLPEKGLPSSLSVLNIDDCPLLEKRCERDKGEDWPNISHISTVKMNYQIIPGLSSSHQAQL